MIDIDASAAIVDGVGGGGTLVDVGRCGQACGGGQDGRSYGNCVTRSRAWERRMWRRRRIRER